jgi:hypothetical protein
MKFSTAVFDTPRRQRDIGSLDNKLAPFHWLLNSNRALYVSLALLALASPPAFAVAPVAVDDGFTTDEDTPLNEAAPGVLGNDTDAEGDPLTAVLDVGPASGTLDVFNADGSFTYTPADDFNGSVNFTYHANDGTADSNIATVTPMTHRWLLTTVLRLRKVVRYLAVRMFGLMTQIRTMRLQI